MKSKKILLIDDDELYCQYLKDFLSVRGYEVEAASNGFSGVQSLAGRQFDVIVTDIVMPVQDGIETIMQSKKKYPAIRIIALSGSYRGDAYLELAQQLGADQVLCKPFEPQQLIDAIEKA
ncbi:MAG: response regulator [Chitinivibrionales bacterium]|nr:response regulator [Chitinivibrionales bacterium]